MPGKPAVSPFNNYGINPLDRNKILEAVNLIKRKRCGKVQGKTAQISANNENTYNQMRVYIHPHVQLQH